MEFEFFLAQKLGMTRARLVTEIGAMEFLLWSRFYSRRAQEAELEAARVR